jgi:hypothetical protein
MRSDCVQVAIALIVTPDGLPLAYEVLANGLGNIGRPIRRSSQNRLAGGPEPFFALKRSSHRLSGNDY